MAKAEKAASAARRGMRSDDSSVAAARDIKRL
jgi:hypothetical protein